MRVGVLVADEDALAGPPHPMLLVVFLQAVEARNHGGVFFGLVFFGAEGVVAEGVEADGFGLVCVEGGGEDGSERTRRRLASWARMDGKLGAGD